MLKVGEVVIGSQFPEPVEIKRCESIEGELYPVEALGRNSSRFYELMIDQQELNSFQNLSTQRTKGRISGDAFRRMLRSRVFENESRYSETRALGSQNLLPLPHQIEAVYSRMLQVPQVRFLLADDPGAGKTIMAGMLIRELKARQAVERVLILVPPLVLTQWQEEMHEKFSMDFTILTRDSLRNNRVNPFLENAHCLASMYWATLDDVKPLVLEADFDLVIVDEAHKMAAYTHGKVKRKVSRTKLFQLGDSLLRRTEHCLLLTATPHKGDVENFRHLMSLLDPDIFSHHSAKETLREKSNPFIIRRLKESLKNFDGSAIFPERQTITLQYLLSPEELELYEAVTSYVRFYFNRALSNRSNSTAFAMMLLQRRLSSSVEAIHLSLVRRKNRLESLLSTTLEERERLFAELENLDLVDYEEQSSDEQEELERLLENAVDLIDVEALEQEIDKLSDLIEHAVRLKAQSIERKYLELEETLFGVNGLLNKGEKILIFTEFVDTLNYLEKKLLERVPRLAKIEGSLSMDARRRQVQLFRDECQIMLATDAGGESINLQFCNQMINYDLPWNPNRLEQRMGRIHRIGQLNEVFVFNLVAQNTREGHVMERLLTKMEQMRTDLGKDLVYDFIGDVLEDNQCDLPTLMQEAIMNRTSLEEVTKKLDVTISKEYQSLIELAKAEQMDSEAINLPGMRRDQHDLLVRKIPDRHFAEFASDTLQAHKVKVYDSQDGSVKRIERIPKFLRDYAHKSQLPLFPANETYRFTGDSRFVTPEIAQMTADHPLFRLSLGLAKEEGEQIPLAKFASSYPVREHLNVEVFSVMIGDGTGQVLAEELLFLAERTDGQVIVLDPYWLFYHEITDSFVDYVNEDAFRLKSKANVHAIDLKRRFQSKRDPQSEKTSSFLRASFQRQYEDTLERLQRYQRENVDNKNAALINQMQANLVDIEIRRDERLAEVARQGNVLVKPPKCIGQIELYPDMASTYRLLPHDYSEIVVDYERANGRSNFKVFDGLGLVDFYSERYNGEPRYIILIHSNEFGVSKRHLIDLQPILGHSYLYVVDNDRIVEEHFLG